MGFKAKNYPGLLLAWKLHYASDLWFGSRGLAYYKVDRVCLSTQSIQFMYSDTCAPVTVNPQLVDWLPVKPVAKKGKLREISGFLGKWQVQAWGVRRKSKIRFFQERQARHPKGARGHADRLFRMS